MALAVAFVACQAAAPAKPKDPDPGPPGKDAPPAPQRPYVDVEFEDINLPATDATGEMYMMQIPLVGHFVDPDAKEGDPPLMYGATSSKPEVVKAEVSGSALTLTAVAEGSRARITVKATDKDGQSSSGAEPGARFYVDVMETVAPIVKSGGIEAQILYLDDGPQTITLTTSEDSEDGYFTHPSAITYTTVSSLPAGVVEVAKADGTLTLTPLVPNSTRVTVVATADGRSTAPVIFVVTVKPGSEPVGPVPDPDPDPMGVTINDVPGTLSITPAAEMMYGEVPLPANHKLSETSDVVDVMAKDAANADSLTMNVWKVMALKKGSVEVMVLDASGTEVKRIMVTVTADPPAGNCPTTMRLAPGDSEKCTLPAGVTMKPRLPDKVDASEELGSTGNVWIVTALEKASDPVPIYLQDATGAPRGQIMVTVLNQAPMRIVKKKNPDQMNLVNAVDLTDTAAVDEAGLYYETGNLMLSDFFSDDDGDELHYKVTVSNNAALVKVTDKSFAVLTTSADGDTKTGGFTLDVLRSLGDFITLTVEAYDGTDAMAAKATGKAIFEFYTLPPKSRATYKATQVASGTEPSGNVSPVDIGNRLGEKHTLTIEDSSHSITTTVGFVFAEGYRKELSEKKMIVTEDATEVVAAASSDAEVVTGKAPKTTARTLAGALDYYKITPRGPIAAELNTDLSGSPMLMITAHAPGTGYIDIDYYVWVKSKAKGPVGNAPADIGDKWESQRKTIKVNVKLCVEFDDCP